MIKLRSLVKGLFALTALFLATHSAAAVYQTSTVAKILTGYSDKSVYFSLNDPTLNPANCEHTSVYGIDPAERDVQASC